MMTLEEGMLQLDRVLSSFTRDKKPASLYIPMDYLLGLKGKRMRPQLCLLAAWALNGKVEEAVYPAAAIELFHNFTLMHDDIMDNAPLRRGMPTVHAKWDISQAILSGDAMLVEAYKMLVLGNSHHLKDGIELFNQTALEVCEGQQMDMDFEQRENVHVEEYMRMITLKTSVLVGASLKMGALTANATPDVQDAFYDFGLNLGLAFQLRDDYLDTFGESLATGKQLGGDILADKKTFLHIRTRQVANPAEIELLELWKGATDNPTKKVLEVKGVMERTGSEVALMELSNSYLDKAMTILGTLPLETEGRNMLANLSEYVTSRKH
jgi:geranylgeranyl diphosphate synthase, type II